MNAPVRDVKVLLRELDLAAEAEETRRNELLRIVQKHRPKAFRTLPYGHPLGPTGNVRTFGHVGGGNRSGTAKPGSHLMAFAHAGGRLPSAFWDFSYAEQLRKFEALRKQHRRIDKNGGERRAAHRPRTITAEQEQRVRDLLAAGVGMKEAAKVVGIGVSGVQRIKRETVPQVVRLTREG